MNRTTIEWTHRPGTVGMTWNPIRARFKDDVGNILKGWACTHASPGCLHCYAETINRRFGTGLPFSVPALSRIEFYLDEKILQEPLKTKKPCTIFVGDMFDLFHEAIPADFIGHVWAVMAQCPQHTFQVLTKRAAEMCDDLRCADAVYGPLDTWPLPNVWCGVSVESQKYADERIPLLLETPAAVRFLSVEPLLEEVDLGTWLYDGYHNCEHAPGVKWVICGGESGPHSRPFNLAWAESLREQCKQADVAFFFKQAGSNPEWPNEYWKGLQPPKLKDRKGGDPSEWPESLRVREWPA
jgi:protein gp37